MIALTERGGLERGQDVAGHAAPAVFGAHEHPFHFGNPRGQRADRPAAHGLAVDVGHEERHPRIVRIVISQPVNGLVGVSTNEVVVECVDERERLVGARP